MLEKGTWDENEHWRATELVAKRIASFRLGLDADNPYAYTENEKLQAAIIIGTLGAGGFLPSIFSAR